MRYMIGDEYGNMWHEGNRFCLNEGSRIFCTKDKAEQKIKELAEKYNPDYEWMLYVYSVIVIDS